MIRPVRRGEIRKIAEWIARGLDGGTARGAEPLHGLAERSRRLLLWQSRLAAWSGVGTGVGATWISEGASGIEAAVAWTLGRQVGWVAAIAVDPDRGGAGALGPLLGGVVAEVRRRGRAELVVPERTIPLPLRAAEELRHLRLRPLASSWTWRRPLAGPLESRPLPLGVRRFRPSDARALLPAARAARPLALERLEPIRPAALSVRAPLLAALGSSSAAFVGLERGRAAGFARGTWGPNVLSAHLVLLLDPSGPRSAGRGALGAALDWCRSKGAPMVRTETPEGPGPFAALLVESGFIVGEAARLFLAEPDGAR